MTRRRRAAQAYPGGDETMLSVTDQNPQTARTRQADEDAVGDRAQNDDADDAPTPQLTQSQAKRLLTPMMGMVITMGVLVAILAAVWFMNPEPDVTYTRDEDVPQAATWADDVAEFSPLSPDVPAEWSANYARWETRTDFGVDVWEVGYTTEAVDFVGFAQTDNANAAWVNAEVDQAPQTGTTTIEELEFRTHEGDDRRYYVLEGQNNDRDGTTVVISGDAAESEFDRAVEAIIDSLGRDVSEAAGHNDDPQDAPNG